MIATLDATSTPTDRSLTGSISTLLALSHLFTDGGEQLSHTLPALVKSSQSLGREFPDIMQLGHNLASYTHDDHSAYQEMGFEFNRLFVGPASPLAPPYESVYLSPDRLVMQEQTLEVRKMYQSKNLMASSQGTVPDDFIATELEFSAYLLNRARQELSEKNPTKASQYLNFYNLFMQEHPRRWLQPFAKAVCENARHPVFPLLMQVLLSTIELSF